MKTKIRLFLLGLFLLTTNIFSQDANFHIYLCFGQSNMEGQGTIETQDKTVDSRFQVMEAVTCSNLGRTMGSWYTAIPPLCRCSTGLSPVDNFGKTMVASLPSNIKVGIVHVAVAGCKIELFDKDGYQTYVPTVASWMVDIINQYGGNPYGRLIQIAKLAQNSGVIKGILLHQGESNVGDNTWPSKVKKIYNDLMTDLSLDPTKVPLLAGEVVNADQGGICAGANSLIAQLPQTISNSYVISSSGCTCGPDYLHFNSAGYRELGRRYAVKMLSLLNSDTTVTGVTVSPTTSSISVGATSQLTATVSPSSATNKDVTWASSNTEIATVSSTGLVTGIASGTAIITVTTVDGAMTATSSITVTTGGTGCTFGTPTAVALPSTNGSYSHAYVLGTGGPNLENVTTFVINWDLPNKGLWQFSMNTNNGQPNWYVDLRTGATQTFALAQPSITLSGTGFPGLDGSYYATIYNTTDLVLVSKTGGFAIYFSSSATAPACVKNAAAALSSARTENNEIALYPNPFNTYLNLTISRPELVNNVFIVDQMGRVISRVEKSQISSINVIGSELPAGIYFIKVVSSDNANIYRIIKR